MQENIIGFKKLKSKIIKKRKKKGRRRRKKENSTELQKPNVEAEVYNMIESVTEYTHIHPLAKSKQSNKNKVQQTDLVNKGNQKLYLPFMNKTN